MVFPHIFIQYCVDKKQKVCFLIFASCCAENDIEQHFYAADGAVA
jgi:hypothetical protein